MPAQQSAKPQCQKSLIFSNGAPKSATSLYFHYTKALLAQTGDQLAQIEKLRNFIDAGNVAGGGQFVRYSDETGIARLVEFALENGPFVVKIHATPTPFFLQLLENPQIAMTYGYRDPRDMVLSGQDHYHRVKRTDPGATHLNAFADFEHALKTAKYWARVSIEWKKAGCAHVWKYGDLVGSPKTEINRMVEFFGIEVNGQQIDQIISDERDSREVGARELNKALLTRFQDEMPAELQAMCNEKLKNELAELGFIG